MLTQARCSRSWTSLPPGKSRLGPSRTTHTFLRSSRKYKNLYRWFKITTFQWETTQKRMNKSDKWSESARTTSAKWTLRNRRRLSLQRPRGASPFSLKDRTKLNSVRQIPFLSQICRMWYIKSMLCLRQGTALMSRITRLYRNKTSGIHSN